MSLRTRRSFLGLAAKASVGGFAAYTLSSCSQETSGSAPASAACADEHNLSPAERSLREASHYVEKSTDAARACSVCAFFTPAEDGGACGHCEIFNGAANPKGRCDSWALKPA